MMQAALFEPPRPSYDPSQPSLTQRGARVPFPPMPAPPPRPAPPAPPAALFRDADMRRVPYQDSVRTPAAAGGGASGGSTYRPNWINPQTQVVPSSAGGAGAPMAIRTIPAPYGAATQAAARWLPTAAAAAGMAGAFTDENSRVRTVGREAGQAVADAAFRGKYAEAAGHGLRGVLAGGVGLGLDVGEAAVRPLVDLGGIVGRGAYTLATGKEWAADAAQKKAPSAPAAPAAPAATPKAPTQAAATPAPSGPRNMYADSAIIDVGRPAPVQAIADDGGQRAWLQQRGVLDAEGKATGGFQHTGHGGIYKRVNPKTGQTEFVGHGGKGAPEESQADKLQRYAYAQAMLGDGTLLNALNQRMDAESNAEYRKATVAASERNSERTYNASKERTDAMVNNSSTAQRVKMASQAAEEIARLEEQVYGGRASNGMPIPAMTFGNDEEKQSYVSKLAAMRSSYEALLQSLAGGEAHAQGGVVGYAEGGEVDYDPMMDETVPAIDEDAVAPGVAAMETGDYIIPVEAVRFYGTKFFKDLIHKVQMAED